MRRRNLFATFRKIHADLPEVCFHLLTVSMIQRNKGLALLPAMLLYKTANRVVAALVSILITKSLEQPHGRMTLLWRCRFSGLQDLPNTVQHRRQLRKPLCLPATVLLRLAASLQHLAHFVPLSLWTSKAAAIRSKPA